LSKTKLLNPQKQLDYLGILIIIIGMGGIIPCVASFGSDQFEPHQEHMISVFFSIFYASINAGFGHQVFDFHHVIIQIVPGH
jgi:dipeptide/tripeptide permease